MKFRAFVVLSSGGIMCFLSVVLSIALAFAVRTHVMNSMSHATEMQFYGASFASLVLFFVSGLVMLANGFVMLKRGRPHQLLTFAMVGGFLVAIAILRQAASLVS